VRLVHPVDYGRLVPNSLLVVHVDIAVRPGQVDAFLAATEENAAASRDEPGVMRFDVLSDRADPGHIVLVEIYRDDAAAAAHKETDHYLRWRDSVAAMMARPRQATRYINTSPDDGAW
jgi:autoinducer 2-degrading protein